MNRQESIIWAAGFVDGEGNINIQRYSSTRGRRHRPCYNLLLQVDQTSPDPLEKLKGLWGGRISKKKPQNPRWAPQWHWWVSGKDAAQALAELRPYLLVKRDQADIALEFAQLKRQRPSQLSKLEENQREGLHLRLRALTKTGPKEPRQEQIEDRPAQAQLRLIS